MIDAASQLVPYLLEMWGAPEGPFARPGVPNEASYPHAGHPIDLLTQPRKDPEAVLSHGGTRGLVADFVDLSVEHQRRLEAGLVGPKGGDTAGLLESDTRLLGGLRRRASTGIWQALRKGAPAETTGRFGELLLSLTRETAVRQMLAGRAFLMATSPQGVIDHYLDGLVLYRRPVVVAALPGLEPLDSLAVSLARVPEGPFASSRMRKIAQPFSSGHPVQLLRDAEGFRRFLRAHQGPILTFLEGSECHQEEVVDSLDSSVLKQLARTDAGFRAVRHDLLRLGRMRRQALVLCRDLVAGPPHPAQLDELRGLLLGITQVGSTRGSIANEALLFGRTIAEAGARFLKGMTDLFARHPVAGGAAAAVMVGIALFHSANSKRDRFV